MSCSWGSIVGGLRTSDDRRGDLLPGPSPPYIPLPRLQHGPGSGVTGGTTTKARKGWHVGDLKDPPPLQPPPGRGRYVPDVVPAGACVIACLVGGCPGRAASRSTLLVHFIYPHMKGTVVILEDGNYPLHICPKCDMFFKWRSLNGRHHTMAMCTRG